MTDIIFTIRVGVSVDDRERLLNRIQALPGVDLAAPVKGDSTSDSLRRIHFARLSGESTVPDCLSAIRDMPEVEQVTIPARRGLQPRA
ncbi:hypothetical protein [Sinorhizobium medicae]|nr:hypothetical protein [Sinorhizobium medicae]